VREDDISLPAAAHGGLDAVNILLANCSVFLDVRLHRQQHPDATARLRATAIAGHEESRIWLNSSSMSSWMSRGGSGRDRQYPDRKVID
jgi:hypothetical protein